MDNVGQNENTEYITVYNKKSYPIVVVLIAMLIMMVCFFICGCNYLQNHIENQANVNNNIVSTI